MIVIVFSSNRHDSTQLAKTRIMPAIKFVPHSGFTWQSINRVNKPPSFKRKSKFFFFISAVDELQVVEETQHIEDDLVPRWLQLTACTASSYCLFRNICILLLRPLILWFVAFMRSPMTVEFVGCRCHQKAVKSLWCLRGSFPMCCISFPTWASLFAQAN